MSRFGASKRCRPSAPAAHDRTQPAGQRRSAAMIAAHIDLSFQGDTQMGSERLQPERIRVEKAASILGISSRAVQSMALRGELPGAAKIGGVWTFSETALRKWIEERTVQPNPVRRNSHTGAETRSGRALPLTVAKSVKACELALQKLRRGV
ncbi:helix-turn-helix domain-containing protein [Xanthobacter sp. AM11]|uniref:helix-turn-helix domain-containing protein n=1 Tax=Xanthobacter sp. AM11 TaxID=3380643 RepID=UPI0039BEF6DF